jgi:hypothetical protein
MWMENGAMTLATATASDSLIWRRSLVHQAPSSLYPGASAKVFDTRRNQIVWVDSSSGSAFSIRTIDSTSHALPSIPEGPSSSYAAIYDVVGDRVIVLGASGDVWSLSMSSTTSWTRIIPMNPIAGRSGHSAIYNSAEHSMVIFGGLASTGGNNFAEGWLDDVWALSLSGAPSWTNLVPNDPRPLSLTIDQRAVFDSTRDRVLYPPGKLEIHYPDWSWQMRTFETWALGLSGTARWERIPTEAAPPAQFGPALVYQPATDRLVLFGGSAAANAPVTQDVWSLGLAPPQWQTLDVAGTPPAECGNAVFVPNPDRMLAVAPTTTSTMHAGVFALSLNDQPAWSEVVTEGTASRFGWVAYAADANKLVLFGSPIYGNPLNAWSLDLNASPPRWQHVDTSGDAPGPARAGSAAYDPSLEAFVVSTPSDSPMPAACGTELESLWMLALNAPNRWQRVASHGIRPASARVLVSTPSGLIAISTGAWRLSIACH